MKMNAKKYFTVLAAVGAISLSMVIPVHASNDNHEYSFYIGSYQGNGYSDARYRQTTNTNNKWKVNMTYSEEGAGTIATYWLALDSGKEQASDFHNVTQGSGAQYYSAQSKASQKNVVLGAENNNYTSSLYRVAGYWDEETD